MPAWLTTPGESGFEASDTRDDPVSAEHSGTEDRAGRALDQYLERAARQPPIDAAAIERVAEGGV